MKFTTNTDVCPASGGECGVSLTLGYAYGEVSFLRAVVTDPGTSTYAAGDAYPTDDMNDARGDWAAWCAEESRQ